MGHSLEMSTGDMRTVVRLLTAVERTPEQDRHLERVRERCTALDVRLESRGVTLGTSVRRALDELIEGDYSSAMCPSYTHAFHEVVASCFSDTVDLGSWRRMSWFQTVSNELGRNGVPAALLPDAYLFNGPPLRIPHPGDVHPQIGTLPVQRAAEAADAYEAVLDRVHPDCRDTAHRLTEVLRLEAQEWEREQKRGGTADTLFFWFS
ncbi:hypothetical protein [Streptomyces sp. NPDC018693]|uniref:DUF7691 family protein n=1 Tax=unclassified Streptomyces TaxID=2593676 RepID=UPI00378FB209